MARKNWETTEVMTPAADAFCRAFTPCGTLLRINSGVAWSRDGKRPIRLAPPGTADHIACLFGVYVEAEAKIEDGVQSPEQVRRQAAVERAGGSYVLYRSAEDLVSQLRELMDRMKPAGEAAVASSSKFAFGGVRDEVRHRQPHEGFDIPAP